MVRRAVGRAHRHSALLERRRHYSLGRRSDRERSGDGHNAGFYDGGNGFIPAGIHDIEAGDENRANSDLCRDRRDRNSFYRLFVQLAVVITRSDRTAPGGFRPGAPRFDPDPSGVRMDTYFNTYPGTYEA